MTRPSPRIHGVVVSIKPFTRMADAWKAPEHGAQVIMAHFAPEVSVAFLADVFAGTA
jgi:hypothetical protein